MIENTVDINNLKNNTILEDSNIIEDLKKYKKVRKIFLDYKSYFITNMFIHTNDELINSLKNINYINKK